MISMMVLKELGDLAKEIFQMAPASESKFCRVPNDDK